MDKGKWDGRLGNHFTKKWASEWVSEWVGEWVSEWVGEFNGLSGASGQRGPYFTGKYYL